ncbi:MAG TPA: hypothetical protein PLE45_06845 [Spirochaetota bacterium]|nr:hypothetical protein [Spirochaetota bacterium]HOL56766.1 hypothetical protein [Spirochaetota bacterium]HPP04447.1 hypothetical protein [Spirochaetota bacterium]
MNIKINLFLFFILSLFILTACISDKYQIKNGERNPVFISEFDNNYNGHLFWFAHKDEKGRYLKDTNNKKILFDPEKDTMIFVHGWQGIGIFGWMEHSILENKGVITGPIFAIISLLYNTPTYGATFPNFEKMESSYNYAIFDWQNYNNITKEHENSENLMILEQYLKNPPKKWPSIPKNFSDEIELLSSFIEPDRNIYIVAHSLGSQVVIMGYNMLSEETKRKIKLVVFLDPFTTEHYNYIAKKTGGDIHWLTGLTNQEVKEDLTKILESSGLKDKLIVISSTDIGKSWVEIFAKPLDIRVIEDDYKDLPFDIFYASKSKKYHDEILKWFFWDKKYNKILNLN